MTLFLGAWALPQGVSSGLREAEAWRAIQILELGVLLAKTFALMLVIALVSRVTPRVRADQITDLAWKVLSPFALAALTGAAAWTGWVALR